MKVSFRLALALYSFVLGFAIISTTARVLDAQDREHPASHHVPPEVLSGKAKMLGLLPASQQINLSVVLPLRDAAGLKQQLARLYDPSDPDYHHFLTVKEFADRFGPTEAQYQAVADFARANGFRVMGQSANRMVVPIAGTVDQVQRTFHVLMKSYQHPVEKRSFFSADREPSFPSSLRIAHLSGLSNFARPKPTSVRAPAASQGSGLAVGSGPGGAYLGRDMRAAYYGNGGLTGQGQVVGLLQYDGYNISDVQLAFAGAATASQSGNDYVLSYTPYAGQPTYTVPIHNVLLDGATGAAGQFSSPADDSEQVLDIAQAIGMAPGLSQVRVYIGALDVDILSAMASENIAKQLSISWLWSPDDPAAVDPLFQEFAAQGQSVFVASGDWGAYSPAVPYYFPAEDSWVTSVGGTSLVTNGAGGSIASETAWDRSGGGISPDGISLPLWQAGVSTSSNGGSTALRNVPDVAMEGDFDNYNCSMGSCLGNWAGTSFAAPRWAAFVALINQQAQSSGDLPVGFINPWLYSAGQGSSYGSQFHDVASGANEYESGYSFYAVPGYDLVTGWGSPAGQNLIDALAPPSSPGFELSTTRSSLTINPGTSASTTIGVIYRGGFTGAVSLAIASQLPPGVTASFATNPTTNASALTITATALAVDQSYDVVIKGVSGALTATTYLTINTPVSAVEIVSPAQPAVPVTAQVFKPGTLIPVEGSIVCVPQSVSVQWARGLNPTTGWSSKGVTMGATAPFADATIATWDTSSVAVADYYTIRVSAAYSVGTIQTSTVVYLEPSLLSANWPKWLDITPDTFSGVLPVQGQDGSTELAFVEPHYINMTAQPRYRVFSPDGSSDTSTNLSFGTYLNPAFGDLIPGQDAQAIIPDAGQMLTLAPDGTSAPLPLSGENVQFQTAQVSLADLKGDSSLATVGYGLQNWNNLAYVFAWGADGQPINSNFPIRVPYQDAAAMWDWNQGISVGDIDGDGNQEIIALETLSGPAFTLALFGNDGAPRSWAVPTIAGRAYQMILTDLDGDGRLQLAIGVLPPGGSTWMLHVFQSDGTERGGWPVALSDEPPFLAAGDFGRTGHQQIVASSWDQVFVLKGDGTSLSSAWPKTTNSFSPFGPPVLADVDGDGFPELVVANGNYSFPQASGMVATTPSRVGSSVVSQSAPVEHASMYPAQVQTAAAPTATPAYFAPVLQAFHPDGTVVRSWNLLGMHGEQPFAWPRLTVGDFNHDGLTDIAIVNGLISGGGTSGWVSEGTVEVITTGTPFNPAANVWPMMYHDSRNSATASQKTARPTFSVPAGAYASTQTVAISDATPGAAIFYTTDGSTPTTASAAYSAPIGVSASQTIRAIATAPAYSQSAIASAIYTINLPAATPVFSLAAGTYTSVQTVAISDATPGATIFYTTDGSTPTTASPTYSAPISVSASQTIRAMATATGYSQSATASALYTIYLPAAIPVFSLAAGTYTSVQTVAISDATPGANIFYTTDGTIPTTASPAYSAPISVSASQTIRAIAIASGYSQSATASALYTINLPAATPVFSLAAGTYTSVQTVVISDATPGATIYYTIDGSSPSSASNPYSGPIPVSSTQTIEAIALAPNYSQSRIASVTYTITLPAIAPAFSPSGGTFAAGQTVTLTSSTPAATIYYTADGSKPTAASNKYTGPVTVSTTKTLNAIAIATGYLASPVTSATYTIAAAVPVFNPAGGTFTASQKISILDSTAGATIYYTTDGTTPTVRSAVYKGTLSISKSAVIKAIAVAPGYSTSSMATASFTRK